MAFDGAGNYYIADWGHNLICRVVVSAGSGIVGDWQFALLLDDGQRQATPGAQQVSRSRLPGPCRWGFRLQPPRSREAAGWKVTPTGGTPLTILTVLYFRAIYPPVGAL